MENRRSKLTKRIIKEALIELLTEEDILKISVKRLCEKAEINRSTFYLHYETIEDLLNEFTNEEMKNIWTNNDHFLSRNDYRKTLDYVLNKPQIFKALLKTNMYHIYIMNQYAKLDFKTDHKLSKLNKEAYQLVCSYTTSGTEQLLLYMLENKQTVSIDDIAEILYNLNKTAIEQIVYLSRSNDKR